MIEGPIFSGKSKIGEGMVADGELDVLIQYSALWAAVRGVRRRRGKYPVRQDSDPFNRRGYGTVLMTEAVKLALSRDLKTGVATSVRNSAPKWQEIAGQHGAGFSVRTVDPGARVITARLMGAVEDAEGHLKEYEISDTGECKRAGVQAVRRWDPVLAAEIARKLAI